LLAALLFSGCSAANSVVAGDRPDAPPLEQRGNATFSFAKFDDEGKYLVTVPFMGPKGGLISWNAETGEMITRLDIQIPMMSRPIWMIDSTHGRMLGQKNALYDHQFQLVDLQTGKIISELPDDNTNDKLPTIAAGLVGDGNDVLLFKPGRIEVWQLDPPLLTRHIDSPFPTDHRYVPSCVGGIAATYNDKRCFEWSPDHRTLAIANTPVFSPRSETHFLLLDTTTLEMKEIKMPADVPDPMLASFAFSPNNRWLAIGLHNAMLLYDLSTDTWGATVKGDLKQRNPLVGPMRFTGDSKRIIALEDQLQISVYDVETGALVGCQKPDFENWEGVFDASRDGSRILVYKFVSDTIEVLDGRDAKRLGFCLPVLLQRQAQPQRAALRGQPGWPPDRGFASPWHGNLGHRHR
jgi:WD40 repeat protein